MENYKTLREYFDKKYHIDLYPETNTDDCVELMIDLGITAQEWGQDVAVVYKGAICTAPVLENRAIAMREACMKLCQALLLNGHLK